MKQFAAFSSIVTYTLLLGCGRTVNEPANRMGDPHAGAEKSHSGAVHTPMPNETIESLCDMLHGPHKRDTAKQELMNRGIVVVRPLLERRLGPHDLYATDTEHLMTMSVIEDIVVNNGRPALTIIKEYVEGLEEPDPLNRQRSRDGHNAATYLHAIEVATELVDRIQTD